jgi:hypothetical protein
MHHTIFDAPVANTLMVLFALRLNVYWMGKAQLFKGKNADQFEAE